MTKAKLYMVLLFLGIGLNQSFAQTYKFKTSGFCVSEKNDKGKWGKWSDLTPSDILVTLDSQKNRIVVYSQIIQLFEIVKYQPESENDTDIVYGFSCIDNNGEECSISIITRKNQGFRKQLYINYEDRIIVYNMTNYKE